MTNAKRTDPDKKKAKDAAMKRRKTAADALRTIVRRLIDRELSGMEPWPEFEVALTSYTKAVDDTPAARNQTV